MNGSIGAGVICLGLLTSQVGVSMCKAREPSYSELGKIELIRDKWGDPTPFRRE